jgi:hypothetical protein
METKCRWCQSEILACVEEGLTLSVSLSAKLSMRSNRPSCPCPNRHPERPHPPPLPSSGSTLPISSRSTKICSPTSR